MSQKFVKGYTNNHATWVMVDATDFATPESALSAATKIKIYGKLKGGTGVNFVSSGTGSLTNDIVHVGASALGIYTIALAKADLSDASAAWYDQYIISLSATGAAYQTLVIDGGIMESYLSAVGSDILSAAVALSGLVSDAHSAAILAASNASEAQSNILLVQSRLSDFQSVYTSDMSDVRSMLTALSDAISDAQSDLRSFIGAGVPLDASTMSDLRSAIAAGPAATVTASDISDIASAVWAAKYTAHSAASSFGSLFSDVYSRVVVIQSAASDALSQALLASSRASDAHSAALLAASAASDAASGVTVLLSRITSVAATSSDLVSKIWSDFQSKMGVSPSQLYSVVLIGASAASDAASAAQQANSRVLLVQSRLSDFQSVYTSDISDVRSMLTALSGAVSNVHSVVDGVVDANVVQVNEVTVSGVGTAGNPWGPG